MFPIANANSYNIFMRNSQHERPMYDLLLQVANPALIIAMVASLIFFLIEIFYRGPHVFRLNVIMFLFTAATVLISRISIEAGKERAALFAGGLGIATLATTSVIVDFEYQQFASLEFVLIIALIVTIMWISNRLVWDCTLLGRTRDVSEMGLTEVIRQKFVRNNDRAPNASERSISSKSKQNEGFNFFEFMLGRNGKNTTPGLWVLYLAVAAFPIFGFGQWFVSPHTSGFSVFLLFAVYLTSGLGLLMVTSLLGLKRYVNKRGITIPESIAMNWLFVGSLFLIGLLLLISFLPRPDFSSSMNDYLVLLGNETKTAAHALGDDNEIPDEPEADADQRNAKPKQGDKQAAEDAPKADGKDGDANDPNSSETKDGSGAKKTNEESGKQPKQNQGDGDQGKGDQGKRNQSDEDKSGDNQKEQSNDNDNQPKDEDGKRNQQKEMRNKKDADNEPAGKPEENPGDDDAANRNKPNKEPEEQGAKQRGAAPPPRPQLATDPSKFRWLVYLLVAAIFVTIGIMYGAEFMKWWRQLSRRTSEQKKTETIETERKTLPAPKPFSAFADPFATGAVQKWPRKQLLQYTFEAIRSWAAEHGVDSTQNFTAEELQNEVSIATGESLKEFSPIFNQTIYGNVPPDKAQLQMLRQIWTFMKQNTRSTTATAL